MKKSLTEIPGTVAYVFSRRINEINFKAPFMEQKKQVIHILQSDEITQKSDALRAIEYIKKANNPNHLYSTVATWAYGIAVGK